MWQLSVSGRLDFSVTKPLRTCRPQRKTTVNTPGGEAAFHPVDGNAAVEVAGAPLELGVAGLGLHRTGAFLDFSADPHELVHEAQFWLVPHRSAGVLV